MNDVVRRGLRAGALIGAVALSVALTPQAAGAAPGPADPRGSCALVRSSVSATTTVDQPLTQRFTGYGDTGGGWTGGDSTYSLPLRGGTTGWFFSDTFLGTVGADGSRPADSPFINNSIVVDDGRSLRTVTGGTPGDPASVFPAEGANSWYWIGDPVRGRAGTVEVPLLHFVKTGTGSFDFAWTANRRGVLDAKTLTLREITDLPSATGINWGSWTEPYRGDTLVYGVKDVDGVRSSFLARTSGAGLGGTWTFWNGNGWSPAEADAVPIAQNVANEYSVSKFRDGWLMVTHDSTVPFDNRIVAKTSCSPTGPFTDAAELYRTPETGATGSYADPDVFTYNSHEHPDLRRGDRLLVTYNVNSFDNVGDVYRDASIYRPRFLDVTLHVRP